jgi:hypothetical protein
MVLFFHGFESSLPSGKVDILNDLGLNAIGVSMNYACENPYSRALDFTVKSQPKLIVGSSMGGYFALMMGTHLNIPLILLNPALVHRSISFDEPMEYGYHRPNIWSLLGAQDDLIPFKENQDELLKFGAIVEIGGHGHRTPNDAFRNYIQGIIGDLG